MKRKVMLSGVVGLLFGAIAFAAPTGSVKMGTAAARSVYGPNEAAIRASAIKSGIPHLHYHVDAYKPGCPFGHCNHPEKYTAWHRDATNEVTRTGCSMVLTSTLKGGTGAPMFIGIIKTWTSFSTQDTMASHAGFTIESTGTTDIASKPALNLGTISTATDTVSASTAATGVTINGGFTVNGFYLDDSSTTGDTTGNLYGGATFTGAPVAAGYTLNITATVSATANNNS